MKLFIIFVLVQIDAKENSILENFNPPKYSFLKHVLSNLVAMQCKLHACAC